MRSEIYEQALTKQGIKWEYVDNISIDSINMVKSLSNQARLEESINEDLVVRYMAADKEGYGFPPLVAWRPGKGSWVLIDGNHRLTAMTRNKKKTVDAYIVNCTDQKVIDRLTWTFNNIVNGKRLTNEECMEHAISFVRKYAVSAKEAAKEWGVNQHILSSRIRNEESREILKKHNIKITPSLTDSVLKTIIPLRSAGEDLFCKVAEVVCVTGATSDDVEDICRAIKKAPTTNDKIKKVEEFSRSQRFIERKAETKGGSTRVKPNGPREQMGRLIKQMHRLLDDYSDSAVQPRSSEWKDVRSQVFEICTRFTVMFGLGSLPRE